MARRSLRPHLNQIRTWVRQGRTDAWVAHQLEVTVQQIEAFKKENDLLPDGETSEAPGVDFDDEIDLRAEDDALIAAELEAEAARKAEAGEDEEPSEEEGDDDAPKRRRGRRGGRGRARVKKGSSYEGTFDHGEEGYGLWLDPAVADDGVYAEHWAGHREVEVTVEADQIVIKRVGGDADDADED
ncbi:MAG: hypothetical protein JWR63_4421 [Conexibacter sp.]|jgi:hypothetical protein|nr:hypothetical protein [Conexibacter sp.]